MTVDAVEKLVVLGHIQTWSYSLSLSSVIIFAGMLQIQERVCLIAQHEVFLQFY